MIADKNFFPTPSWVPSTAVGVCSIREGLLPVNLPGSLALFDIQYNKLQCHPIRLELIIGSLAVLAVIASATKPRFATSALLLSRQLVAAPLLRSTLKTIICLFLSGRCLAFKLSVTSQKSNFSANLIDPLSCQQQTVAKALINIESLACFSKTLPLRRLSYF